MEGCKFKQICFNELTLEPLCSNTTEAYERIETYGKTIKESILRLGTKHVRYPDDSHNIILYDNVSLHEFCSKYKHQSEFKLILSAFTMPLVDSKGESVTFDDGNTSVSTMINGEEKDSMGLSAAYVYRVPAIGFKSESVWDDVMHTIHIGSNNQVEDAVWPCITLPEHLSQNEFKEWIQKIGKIELLETSLHPSEKEISLRDDHGKDVLFKHAKKLCHSKYVIGVVTSLPFKSHDGGYVRRVTPEGMIDIVLFWDDRGLSMRVKTTGRNIQETSKIAEILDEEYSE